MTNYNFFKMGNDYEYVKDGELYRFSAEMMGCMIRQYRLKGYHVEMTELWVMVVKTF